MPRRIALAVVVLVTVVSAARGAGVPLAPATVLLRAGDAAGGGLALDGFSQPVAHDVGDVAFVGTTSAILVRQGTGTTTVLAKTGDPAPGGAGTFDAVGDSAVDDAGTFVAFTASLNGGPPGGIFLAEGGRLSAVAVGDPPPLVPAVNGRGDVVYRQGSTLWFGAHGSGTSVPVVSLGDPVLAARRGRFIGRPVVSDGGAVAFLIDGRTAGGGGVFAWTAAGGVVPIGRVGDPSPAGGLPFLASNRQAVAINAAGQVAFTTTVGAGTAVFSWDPATGTASLVATSGTAVGDAAITVVDPEYVGIDAAGRVAFEARFGGGGGGGRRLLLADAGTISVLTPLEAGANDFRPGLTPGGRITWSRGGSIEAYDGGRRVLVAPADVPLGPGFTLARGGLGDGGLVVCTATGTALYRLQDGTVRTVLRAGDTLSGIGPLGVDADLRTAFRGDSLLVLANDGNERYVLAVDGPQGLAKVVATGDIASVGGTLAPRASIAADVEGRTVAYSASLTLPDGSSESGIFRVKPGGQPRLAARSGDAVAGSGLGSITLLAGVRRPVFTSTLNDGRAGLFVLRGKRVAALAVGGAPAPKGGVFGDLHLVRVAGARALFTAAIGSGDSAPEGLFRVRGKQVQRIAATGDPSPAGGIFAHFDAVELAGDQAVFQATIMDAAGTRTGLFRGRPGNVERIVVTGDAVPGGGTLSFDTTDGTPRVTVDGPNVGFVGGESTPAGTIQSGVFAIRRETVQTVALAGQATPLGGTYAFFADEDLAPADHALVFTAAIDGVADARAGLFAAVRKR